MVKLNLSLVGLIVMLGVLTIIQIIPTNLFGVYLEPLHNFQKIISYIVLFSLLHFIMGITFLGVYKFFKLVIGNDFV